MSAAAVHTASDGMGSHGLAAEVRATYTSVVEREQVHNRFVYSPSTPYHGTGTRVVLKRRRIMVPWYHEYGCTRLYSVGSMVTTEFHMDLVHVRVQRTLFLFMKNS